MTAQEYFNSFSPEDQEAIRQSWGGQDLLNEWFQNAQNAGAVPQGGGGDGGGGGSYGPGWTPKNKAELVQYAADHGWSEDFARFDEGTVMSWVNNHWDPQAGAFKTEKTDPQGNPIEGFVEKPVDTPEGWEAWGQFARRKGEGGGGGGAGAWGGGGGGGQGGMGGGPYDLTPPEFKAPTWEEAINDPGYQFSLKQGEEALKRSQGAQGLLRTGGSLKDLLDYGQDRAAQQYGDVWGRALQDYGTKANTWNTLFGANENRWQTRYGGDLAKWQTQYQGDLSKYLQREGSIYDLLSAPPPTYGG